MVPIVRLIDGVYAELLSIRLFVFSVITVLMFGIGVYFGYKAFIKAKLIGRNGAILAVLWCPVFLALSLFLSGYLFQWQVNLVYRLKHPETEGFYPVHWRILNLVRAEGDLERALEEIKNTSDKQITINDQRSHYLYQHGLLGKAVVFEVYSDAKGNPRRIVSSPHMPK
jgi:hypothetical protein